MLKAIKRMLSLLLALAMVIGMIPMMHAHAEDALVPPVMEADDDSWDIPLSALSVSCGDYEPNGGSAEGPANLAVDGNTSTMWHTDWEGTNRDDHWFQFTVNGDYTVCGLRYLPRQTGNSNGTITQYDIQVSDDGVTFRSVASGNWAADSTWKIAQFAGENAKYVRLVSLNAVSDNSWVFASAAEIRLTYLPTQVSDADKTALNALIAECEEIEQGNYTAKSWQQFQNALKKAQTISGNAYASQEQVDEAYEALAQAKAALVEKGEDDGVQKIFHLDSGRKFFSKDWTIALLNELADAGYTHLQLAFGNNGFRFLLDDMTIEANGTTYASDDVKEGIRIGNANYYDEGEKHSLNESEMNEILAHAQRVGIQIIPHLNMPGHMSALLDAMVHVGISDAHFTGSVPSDSSVNLNNEAALNFMFALTDKYAEYFAEHGCKYFHIGADEYANDAYNGSMGFPSMGSALYQKFADFVNQNAAIVKRHGMTPRAWNDGIYYGSYTSVFDSDIEINYWSSGWWGYSLASASALDGKGHGLINTNGDYYYILGKDDRFTSGTSTRHSPNLYTECAGYDLNRFMDGSTIEEPVGGMFCVWADYPGAETETEVAANIRLVLRAMSLRMDGLEIGDLDTSVVPGGFNADGTINETEVHEHEFEQENTDEEYLASVATCENPATYYYSCECGEKGTETFEYGEALGHDYVDGSCTRCGEADPDYVAPKTNEVIRLAGSNRFDTAVKVADEMKAQLGLEKFDYVILTDGYNFADALAGSYLSAVKDAPILLTWNGDPKFNVLNDTTVQYIKDNLKPGGTVYILGGTAAVPASIDAALTEANFNVERMDGENRFETNIMILEEAGVQPGSEILVCTSTNFADSLSASAAAKPILLVWNEGSMLFEVQTDYLAELQNCSFTVIGGESAVSTNLADTLASYGDVSRLAGENRFETSVLVADKYFPEAESAVLAYAWDFPDGLCGGALAYSMKAPLILTMTNFEETAVQYTTAEGIGSGVVLGGEKLISDASVRAVFAMNDGDEIVIK